MVKYTLGIDVAQKKGDWVVFDPMARQPVAQGQVDMEPQALAQWVQEMKRYPLERAAVEASGGWEKPVVKALQQGQIPVIVANPKRTHSLRETMSWAKTDTLDAQVIALYAWLRPQSTSQAAPQREKVAALLKRREHLVECRQRERQRYHRATDEVVKESLARSLDFLNEEIKRVEEALREALEAWEQAEPEVGETRSLLESVPGVGWLTALALLVWLPELGHLDRRTVARLTGTAPLANDSGQKRGRRRVRGGRKRVRRYLYLSALSASRYAEPLQAFYQRLLEAHKPKHVALVAVMRRLVVILNAMVRTRQPWEPALARPRAS